MVTAATVLVVSEMVVVVVDGDSVVDVVVALPQAANRSTVRRAGATRRIPERYDESRRMPIRSIGSLGPVFDAMDQGTSGTSCEGNADIAAGGGVSQ